MVRGWSKVLVLPPVRLAAGWDAPERFTQRGELQAYLRKRNLPASVAQRMRIVLLLDEGASYRDIEEKLGTPASTISRWKQRYQWMRPQHRAGPFRTACGSDVGASEPFRYVSWGVILKQLRPRKFM